jgi:hypothetical protein
MYKASAKEEEIWPRSLKMIQVSHLKYESGPALREIMFSHATVKP